MQRVPRVSRSRERGQMIPLAAIFSMLFIAAMAIATDLSVNTHFKRHLQNVTDAAALAGARHLPSSPAPGDEAAAAAAALAVVHNTFPWPAGSNWTQALTASGCGAQCSVTVCAGMTLAATPCTATVATGSNYPFVVTVNAPPRSAAVSSYNGDAHRVEVVMHERSSAFFAGIFGQTSSLEGATSIAYHFAAGQPFPFALFSRTVIQAGNEGEVIGGNIYADRYIAPQANGHSGICAGPNDAGTPGYIFLGYPQQDDGAAAYHGDGQSTSRGDPVTEGVSCPVSGGSVGMSASPVNAAGCAAGYPGNNGAYSFTFDALDGACETNRPVQPPSVAPPPNLPSYASSVCRNAGLVGNIYQPAEYRCGSGAALTVDHPLAPGIYEIDAGANSGGCDVQMDATITSLSGVTFYLRNGAGICVAIPSGQTITQTPYNAGTGAPGDGRYIVLSDNVAAPSITLGSGGGGSTSGIWNVSGAIWLPSGSVTINNKSALEVSGQVVVNSWNDQSGFHQNPSVSYNPTLAPQQQETLQLAA